MSAAVSASQPANFFKPLPKLLSGGSEIVGLEEFSITETNHFQATRFHCVMALNAIGGQTLAWWSKQEKLPVDIHFRVRDADQFVSIFQGEADTVHIDVFNGRVEIDDRDYAARLIDTKIQEAFVNQTSSQIATTLAGRHGLKAVVTPTNRLAYRYYNQDHTQGAHDQFSRATTEWELLEFLAQNEGFDLYVRGMELHFEAVGADKPKEFTINCDPINVTCNVIDLKLDRALTLAKDVEVQVRSWNSRQGRAFTKTARRTGAKAAGPTSQTQRFAVIRPNLSEDQAQKLANSMLAEISAHEKKIAFSLPGNLDLSSRSKITLNGTKSDWDQAYYVSQITRTYSFDEGYLVAVEAKNHDPRSEVSDA